MKADIDLPTPPLIKVKTDYVKWCSIIKIKMHRDPEPAVLQTYELKIATYENDKPEKFLVLMKNFKTKIDGI